VTGLAQARVLVIGCGGLAASATRALVEAGLRALTLVDDDRVDLSNLHRQTLFRTEDLGRSKVEAAAEALRALPRPHAAPVQVETRTTRFLPDNAETLLAGHDLVIDGTDNLASKFLVADAARLARIPAVHGGVVRWTGWALASAASQGPCMRCVFEDLPAGRVETCAGAGVVGPVVGVVSALSAALVVDLLAHADVAAGRLYSYDALGRGLRQTRVRARSGCPLCDGQVADLNISRYMTCRPFPSNQESPCP